MTQKPETSLTILNNLCQTSKWRPTYTVSGTKEDYTTYDILTYSLESAGNTWIKEGCSGKLKAKESVATKALNEVHINSNNDKDKKSVGQILGPRHTCKALGLYQQPREIRR